MRATVFVLALAATSVAAPVRLNQDTALEVRQNNAGSTSTSTSNCSGLLCGLSSSGASAAETGPNNGSATSSTTSCGIAGCAGSAAGASPGGGASSASNASGPYVLPLRREAWSGSESVVADRTRVSRSGNNKVKRWVLNTLAMMAGSVAPM